MSAPSPALVSAKAFSGSARAPVLTGCRSWRLIIAIDPGLLDPSFIAILIF
jgi:hypothetical protein